MKRENQFAAVERRLNDIKETYNADKLLILTDTNVSRLTETLLPEVPRLIMEPGEVSKSIEGAVRVWRFMEERRALRRTILVNVGGGMISDLGGFAASTFKRGIKCVNLPTTLLSAVDAAIGGKTGINFDGLKNEIGTFSLPIDVLPLTSLFGYLSEQEWLSGVGEAIKTGFLAGGRLFELALSEEFILHRKPEIVDEVVALCSSFKQSVVEKDFREGGLRKILNLGHTAGHGIEALMLEKGTPVPHGVAVAHGLLFTLRKSNEEEGLDMGIIREYEDTLRRYFPPLLLDEEDLCKIEMFMSRDKKNVCEGKVEWVLLADIGKPVV